MTTTMFHSAPPGETPEDPVKTRILVIACATVIEEMLPLLPPDVGHRILDFGLHTDPPKLRKALQEAIDESKGRADTILLGYGLCSQGVIGLRANGCTLVVPRVDDCISIFLGSASAYKKQSRSEPGTYYLTKGWIEVEKAPFRNMRRPSPGTAGNGQNGYTASCSRTTPGWPLSTQVSTNWRSTVIMRGALRSGLSYAMKR